MSSLKHVEKKKLERLLKMEGGYVLEFSNSTFAEFVDESVSRDPYDPRYEAHGTSKANRLRAFWEIEDDHTVARLLSDLVDLAESEGADESAVGDGRAIAGRLRESQHVPDTSALLPNANGPGFKLLADEVRRTIEDGKPEAGLDRLHSFVTLFLRTMCEKRGVLTPPDKPLHSLLGELIKQLKSEGKLESDMGEVILKSSIRILEKFNQVRNDQSFAHANELLTRDEAVLIFNNISGTIRFLTTLDKLPESNGGAEIQDLDDISF